MTKYFFKRPSKEMIADLAKNHGINVGKLSDCYFANLAGHAAVLENLDYRICIDVYLGSAYLIVNKFYAESEDEKDYIVHLSFDELFSAGYLEVINDVPKPVSESVPEPGPISAGSTLPFESVDYLEDHLESFEPVTKINFSSAARSPTP